MSSLTPTARVILGMLKLGVGTGYDIKKVIDFSTRFFWTASYGQIYPELRGLEQAGLVQAREEPHGRRPRRVFELLERLVLELAVLASDPVFHGAEPPAAERCARQTGAKRTSGRGGATQTHRSGADGWPRRSDPAHGV